MFLLIAETLLFVLCAVAFFFLFSGMARLPSKRKVSSVARMSALLPGRQSAADHLVRQFGRVIAAHLDFPQYIKDRLQEELDILEINTTAVRYVADCIAKGILISAWAIPFGVIAALPVLDKSGHLVFGFLTVVIFAAGIAIGIGDYQHIDVIFKQRRDEIEEELPPFVSLIQQTFRHDVNVPLLIENYTKTDETALTKELKIVLADMQTGSTELALTHMDKRVNSLWLSETVRGLIAASRGENTTEYFFTLDAKLSEEQEARVEAKFMRLAPKIKRIAFLNLINIALIYAVPLLMSGMSGLGQIFNFS